MTPTISSYTTTYNCRERGYPFEECITSLLGFSDEIVVVDAGSEDGTIEVLRRIAARESRVRFFVEPVDFTAPRWAIHMDGYLKGRARRACTSEYCWQTDTDEIVPEEVASRVRLLPEAARDILSQYPVLHLPMVEFWGSFHRIRADFVTVKPRFSVNDARIVHGVPARSRSIDAAGEEYPTPFESDSCDYIWQESGESVPVLLPFQPPLRKALRTSDGLRRHWRRFRMCFMCHGSTCPERLHIIVSSGLNFMPQCTTSTMMIRGRRM